MRFRKSRFHFWFGYLGAILTFAVGVFFFYLGGFLAGLIAFALGFVFIALSEIVIRLEYLELNDNEAVHNIGILSRKVVRVPFRSLSDVSTHQTILQRLLRMGDVEIDAVGHSVEIHLHDYSDPVRIETEVNLRAHRRTK